MTDAIDLAQAREEEHRADALAEHARSHPASATESALTCAVCDDLIPEARRAACVHCQADLELAVRQSARAGHGAR
jgi:RNA polymerase-binding transcription factor DksA